MPLKLLDRPNSIELLRKHRPELSADDPILDAIADELGDLPLALRLAGGYLKSYRQAVTPRQYLEQLREGKLLEHPSLQGRGTGFSATEHDLHVGQTFALSYKRLDPTNEIDSIARSLLSRAAYFAHGEPIARELLLSTLPQSENSGDDSLAGLQTEDAINRVTDLGLLEIGESGAPILHRLLAVFVQGCPSDDDAQAAVEEALLDEGGRLKEKGYPTALVAAALPHLLARADATLTSKSPFAARLCSVTGSILQDQGDLDGALTYTKRALAIDEKVFGPEHPNVAIRANNIGQILQDQGDLDGALTYAKRALDILERVYGPDNPNTAIARRNFEFLKRVLQ